MNYQERLRAHLVKYKFRVLRVLDGPKPHVLPAAQARLNILAPFRERFWREFDDLASREPGRLRLHPDFANLASSQAMGFNLFYPLLADAGWAGAFLQHAAALKDAAPRRLAFEHAADPEGNTHFDFCVELASGAKLRFETRLGELVFATVAGHTPYLVAPKANLSLMQALSQPSRPGQRLQVLHLEELCGKLKGALRGREGPLKAHYREFADKYLVSQF